MSVDISIVIGAFNMQRELPRTIFTFGRSYQRGAAALNYEIIVADNGSSPAVDEERLQAIDPNVRVLRAGVASSPAVLINQAADAAAGRLIGVVIDGARMASPGLLSAAWDAYRADPRRAIGTYAFHLGPDVQSKTMLSGYNQQVEDALLDTIPWREDGYRLFDISVLATSSGRGWFGTISESNALFLDRALWRALDGLDERFRSPGGGYVNLDFWSRAVAASDHAPWVILGEGTFHQFHGGAATNGTEEDRAPMRDEYERIKGERHRAVQYVPRYIGSVDADLARSFGFSPKRTSSRQAHEIAGRRFAVGLPEDVLVAVQAGTLKTKYKGRRLAKNPFDLALYPRLLARLKPKTIIEVGTSEGGSAIWLHDQCRALGLKSTVITMDLKLPARPLDVGSFFEVDGTRPGETFPHSVIEAAAHPWLVIEDSAHTYECTRAVLEYFDGRLESGDYIVVEDGAVADLPGKQYQQYEDGPNRAVRDFLTANPERYAIDTNLCDFYGPNVTYCPNGWLFRT